MMTREIVIKLNMRVLLFYVYADCVRTKATRRVPREIETPLLFADTVPGMIVVRPALSFAAGAFVPSGFIAALDVLPELAETVTSRTNVILSPAKRGRARLLGLPLASVAPMICGIGSCMKRELRCASVRLSVKAAAASPALTSISKS